MMSFIGVTLANCHLEIQSRLEIENVLNEIIGVVEISHMERELLDLQQKLAASELSTQNFEVEINDLSIDKMAYDSEFDRIRSEAVYVRECLVHDIVSILSERRQINDYQNRIRELEDRIVDLINFIESGRHKEDSGNELPSKTNNIQQADIVDLQHTYEFADSIVQNISKSNAISYQSDQLNSTRRFPQLISNLDNTCLLLTLSFLDTSVVLNVSQTNRELCARLNQLFQNGSTIVKKSWLTRSIESTASDQTVANNLPIIDLIVVSEECGKSISSSSDTTRSHPVSAADESTSSSISRGPAGEGRYFGKFSMLLAAADMLPTGLTAGVMSAVGVKMNAIPSSPASISSGSSFGKSGSTQKYGSMATASPTLASASGALSTTSSALSSGGGLTREIAESLSKKLSATEMRAIINMDDLLKKNTSKLEIFTADNEDLTSKLEGILTMRDFLISKLKGAEVALKASMTESTILRKQAKADEEVINYLDLRGQEYEGKNVELTLRSEQLQAAYNLQCGSFSHRENQLFAELAEYKTKYDDLEIMYRSHKRMLVREVKTLRGQLGTISLERNKYITQLLTVKNVLSLHNENN